MSRFQRHVSRNTWTWWMAHPTRLILSYQWPKVTHYLNYSIYITSCGPAHNLLTSQRLMIQRLSGLLYKGLLPTRIEFCNKKFERARIS